LPELPSTAQLQRHGEAAPSAERLPKIDESADWLTRTALCAEAREGRLYLFMPPLERVEDYLELVAGHRSHRRRAALPGAAGGLRAPADYRLSNFRVTPDPGVIEVNVQPSATWDELVERTEFLYEEARQTRLTTEKFMIDGRHTGTGGGNHFVLGGATPKDSPFLRRPDLLRSLISYWHNHPSLSYLFPACSSARRPRRPGSMKRVTMRCMSWKSPSRKCPRQAKNARRGWSTACCAIC